MVGAEAPEGTLNPGKASRDVVELPGLHRVRWRERNTDFFARLEDSSILAQLSVAIPREQFLPGVLLQRIDDRADIGEREVALSSRSGLVFEPVAVSQP